jgi:hypothetical protein
MEIDTLLSQVFAERLEKSNLGSSEVENIT